MEDGGRLQMRRMEDIGRESGLLIRKKKQSRKWRGWVREEK